YAIGQWIHSHRCEGGPAQRQPGSADRRGDGTGGGAGESERAVEEGWVGGSHAGDPTMTASALPQPKRRSRRFSIGRYFGDIALAIDNLRGQKTRTLLTALGIVFGVGSVIGMLADGAGGRGG